jgi:bifunctional pyridoxal-dependent enzyme with beta-cystathionase and maltose regulon repressor activities
VLWCGLPGRRSHALVAAAERHGLHLAAGPLFGTGHALDDRLRLPFTQPREVLERAVAVLARADAEASGHPRVARDRGPAVSVV